MIFINNGVCECKQYEVSVHFMCKHFIAFRGVILYAMVCGRLPFGDDAQVKKLQAHQRRLEFSRNLTAGM